MGPLVILGCGYVGARLARAAIAEGRVVRACARSTGRLAPLATLGVQVKYVDAASPKQFTAALNGMAGATVVYSIPPAAALPPGHAMRAALQAAYGVGAGCFIYFSSAGLYGPLPDDDVWIDEDTPVAHDDPPMKNILADEDAIDGCQFDALRTIVLRLAPVYGPGRGMRERLRKKEFRILDDGQHATSRIHVDDVVAGARRGDREQVEAAFDQGRAGQKRRADFQGRQKLIAVRGRQRFPVALGRVGELQPLEMNVLFVGQDRLGHRVHPGLEINQVLSRRCHVSVSLGLPPPSVLVVASARSSDNSASGRKFLI